MIKLLYHESSSDEEINNYNRRFFKNIIGKNQHLKFYIRQLRFKIYSYIKVILLTSYTFHKGFFGTSIFYISFYILAYTREAGCGAVAQSVTVKSTGCGFDPHSRK